MISFQKFELKNGLKVIIHEDHTTPMTAVNILYDVGSRDENPNHTGFAHLFEHLMFGGSENIDKFDQKLERAGGRCNAFTSQDITNYYDIIPAVNIETVLWLESDRMRQLKFDEKRLKNQKDVVTEEFKQSYLNQPFGDLWLKLYPLCFKVHPYSWITIGKSIEHVQKATLKDVEKFFYKYYRPNNAILVVAGNVKTEKAIKQIEKWFSDIDHSHVPPRNLHKEPKQRTERTLTVNGNVPFDALTMAFHMDKRKSKKYYQANVLADILASGKSSRFYQNLVKKKRLFSSIEASTTGDLDPGLFIIQGDLLPGITVEKAEKAIWAELTKIKDSLVTKKELNAIKNQNEYAFEMSKYSLQGRAVNLATYELLGDANLVNTDIENFNEVRDSDVQNVANEILRERNCSGLYYLRD